MKLALMAAPVVALYWPTVPYPLLRKLATKRMLRDNASSEGSLNPVMKLALIAAPVLALYWPTVPLDNILLGFESLLNPIL
jgi:hypothetical protein